MITEDYVSFETAKLLKEKGFDVCVSSFYNNDGELSRKEADWNWNIGPHYSAPTHQMAMKWLREKEIFPEVTYTLFSSPHKYQYSVFRIEPEFYTTSNWYKSYETACDAAIRYCLENLI